GRDKRPFLFIIKLMQTFNTADLHAIKTNDGLEDCIRQLQDIARSIASTPHLASNWFVRMTAACLLRGARHADSLIALKDSLDSWLIVRSLLEGYALYSWIASDPSKRDERIALYRNVAYVEAHTLRTRMGKYTGVPETDFSKSIKDAAQAFQKLSVKEGMKIAQGEEPYAISYIERVTDKKIKQIFEELDKELDAGDIHKSIYELQYSMFSGYHHWNPLFFLVSDSNKFEFYDARPSDYGMSLSAFLGAFIGMCSLADKILESKLGDKIDAIQKRHENLITP
ncbi:MAG TPA: DUF5677 domain-containing protein, partial [Candidatus Kapabacteria bacterium]|nr:DUF5677 domain-containing protein [Candidatus Kapabacteria bacterium]